MRSTTATSLRKELFTVLERAAHAIPTRVRYKKGDAIILSYQQYLALKNSGTKNENPQILLPLLSGKINKPLDKNAEDELMQYMGLE